MTLPMNSACPKTISFFGFPVDYINTGHEGRFRFRHFCGNTIRSKYIFISCVNGSVISSGSIDGVISILETVDTVLPEND